jgi:hypothetical protein
MIYTSAILATMLGRCAVSMKQPVSTNKNLGQCLGGFDDDEKSGSGDEPRPLVPWVTGVRLPNGELTPCPPNPGRINWQFIAGTRDLNPAWIQQAKIKTIKTEVNPFGLGHEMIASATVKVDDDKVMHMREMVWWSTPPPEMRGGAPEFKTFDVAGCQFGRQSNEIYEIPDFDSITADSPILGMPGVFVHRDTHLMSAKKINWDLLPNRGDSTPKFTCDQVWQTAVFGKLISENMKLGSTRKNIMCRIPLDDGTISDDYYVADFPLEERGYYLKMKSVNRLKDDFIRQDPAAAHAIKHLSGEDFYLASRDDFGELPYKMTVRLIDDRLPEEYVEREMELTTEHFRRPNDELSQPGEIEEYLQSRVWNEVPNSRFTIKRWADRTKVRKTKQVHMCKDINHDANCGGHHIPHKDAFPIAKHENGEPYGLK